MGQSPPTHAHAEALAATEPGSTSYAVPVSTGLAWLYTYHLGKTVMRILLKLFALFSVASVCSCIAKSLLLHW